MWMEWFMDPFLSMLIVCVALLLGSHSLLFGKIDTRFKKPLFIINALVFFGIMFAGYMEKEIRYVILGAIGISIHIIMIKIGSFK